MDAELQEKIARLPAWARRYIAHLEATPETLVDECASLRVKLDHERERNQRLLCQIEAMTEMFRCAAVGGSEGAKHVVSILEGYEIFPTKETGT